MMQRHRVQGRRYLSAGAVRAGSADKMVDLTQRGRSAADIGQLIDANAPEGWSISSRPDCYGSKRPTKKLNWARLP